MFPLWVERFCLAAVPILIPALFALFAWIAIARKRFDLLRVLIAVTFVAVAFAIIYKTKVDQAKANLPEIGRPLPPEPEPEPEEFPDAVPN